jgi:hypothetical protein
MSDPEHRLKALRPANTSPTKMLPPGQELSLPHRSCSDELMGHVSRVKWTRLAASPPLLPGETWPHRLLFPVWTHVSLVPTGGTSREQLCGGTTAQVFRLKSSRRRSTRRAGMRRSRITQQAVRHPGRAHCTGSSAGRRGAWGSSWCGAPPSWTTSWLPVTIFVRRRWIHSRPARHFRRSATE